MRGQDLHSAPLPGALYEWGTVQTEVRYLVEPYFRKLLDGSPAGYIYVRNT